MPRDARPKTTWRKMAGSRVKICAIISREPPKNGKKSIMMIYCNSMSREDHIKSRLHSEHQKVLKYGETHTKATPSVYFFCKRK